MQSSQNTIKGVLKMEVLIFESAEIYQEWVNHFLDYPIEIISTLVLNGKIILTYKRK